MTLGPGRLGLFIGAAVVVLLIGLGLATGTSEQRRLDRARRAEVAQRTALRDARTAVADERRVLNAAYIATATLANEVQAGNADVASTQNNLTVAYAALQRARSVLTSQSSRREIVEQCLQGVKLALDATRVRNAAAATAFLRVVAPACQSALTPEGEAAPVLAFDFADPFVMRVGRDYYAFATNAAGGSVQAASSTDLVHWDFEGNALGNLPSWAIGGSVWAPATLYRPPLTILYYTVREAATGRQCISRAAGVAPGGPFLEGSTGPMTCGETGAIDPSPFVDAKGAPYLLYKTERPARIWSRPLRADGLGFTGPARLMLTPSRRWEGGNVEAPSMLVNGSAYWLFYSGNDWNGAAYAEGVARCEGPLGPCRADRADPVLASRGSAAGPGGGEVFMDAEGGWRLAHHAYQVPLVGYPNSRLLYLARIGFGPDGRPVLSP